MNTQRDDARGAAALARALTHSDANSTTAATGAAELQAALMAPLGAAHAAIRAGTSALDLIKALAAQGNAHGWICDQLNRANVPTTSGRGRWGKGALDRFARKHSIAIGYRPVLIRSA
jgi:hypothetical protein